MKRSRFIKWLLAPLALVNGLLLTSLALDKQYVRETAFRAAPPGLPQREIVSRLSRYVHEEVIPRSPDEVAAMPWHLRWLYTRNFFRPGPATILQTGAHHLGPCQSNSRALMELFAAHGIESRLVFLHNDELKGFHSVIEVDYDGCRGIVSGSSGVVYQHSGGRPATIEELRTDRELFAANASKGDIRTWGPGSTRVTLPYPIDEYRFDKAYYINFRWFGPARWFVFRWTHQLFDGAGNYFIAFPRWYNYPAITYLILCDGCALLACIVYRVLKRRSNRRDSQGDPREPAAIRASARPHATLSGASNLVVTR